jgi:hypothetical protein
MADDFAETDDDAEVVTGEGDPFAGQKARAADRGGFCLELDHHVLTWLPGRGERLVVSWDNLAAFRDGMDRLAWGQDFLLAQGFDLLGVQIKRRDWFRSAETIRALTDLRDDGFFRRFPAVSMYGSSMGAFAALAFAPLAPGCTVMALAPQRSLDPRLAPWEKRWRSARLSTDWTLPFGDAAEGARAASRAFVGYDPTDADDRRQVDALAGPTVTRLPMRYLGHKLPPALLKMGLLKKLSLAGFEGTLTEAEFARWMRARRESIPWRVDLLNRARARGHLKLAHRLAVWMMADRPHWKIRHLRKELAAELGAG